MVFLVYELRSGTTLTLRYASLERGKAEQTLLQFMNLFALGDRWWNIIEVPSAQYDGIDELVQEESYWFVARLQTESFDEHPTLRLHTIGIWKHIDEVPEELRNEEESNELWVEECVLH
jgi:hypothetical protein